MENVHRQTYSVVGRGLWVPGWTFIFATADIVVVVVEEEEEEEESDRRLSDVVIFVPHFQIEKAHARYIAQIRLDVRFGEHVVEAYR